MDNPDDLATRRIKTNTQHNMCWTPLYTNELCHPLKDYLIRYTIKLDISVFSLI